jgi:hypothetical protein
LPILRLKVTTQLYSHTAKQVHIVDKFCSDSIYLLIGTGKTYTMEGFNRDGNVENRGIIPRAIEQIFSHIQRHASPRMRFLVRASYLQIYNEMVE